MEGNLPAAHDCTTLNSTVLCREVLCSLNVRAEQLITHDEPRVVDSNGLTARVSPLYALVMPATSLKPDLAHSSLQYCAQTLRWGCLCPLPGPQCPLLEVPCP